MTSRGTLLAIASNPPLQTSGRRTLARIEQAQRILGFDSNLLVNLFSFASYRTGDVAELGSTEDGWHRARPALQEGINRADGVLLAYGASAPGGPARQHFHEQVRWLADELAVAQKPAWWVGGTARHPSRWQRFTCRAHPGMDFGEALPLAIQTVPMAVLAGTQSSSGKT
ncbi:DUF1643 domain-containing protein [Arthrobacter pascens]|uniref:DUF1643 domain-containing protein n=1 Tax=Arthrobacter pascens TaxID=1677 RepID=UPI00358F5966